MMKRYHTPQKMRVWQLMMVLAIAIPSISQAQSPAFANIIGETQGEIPGSVVTAGKEGTIELESYSNNISAAYDDATGMPTGNRQHRPVRLVKFVDKASAPLVNAMRDNELLTSVTIRFWRAAGEVGAQQNYSTVTLNDAHITSIIRYKADSPEDANNPIRESISMTYRRITTTDEINDLSAIDYWVTP